ncbi:CPBP family intramembrane glutamic endopeptidase [Alkalihalobacillus pseudalcaliphilus]|uniref:CPBP family intramembrane glutamic endopeptidase n=1 Tax=Alkalihalobacillus pseudalcaliphilus TaxID=79884 RepID=UPI00064D7B4F|nr:CPBP family intramembrane glutamic endopeptidase [Alkalihalobacillus pseudalcaliphilus]KMK76477.1 hypothetical protein AB990_14940 [Alkalihalobacillus pseudalcaliphilus]
MKQTHVTIEQLTVKGLTISVYLTQGLLLLLAGILSLLFFEQWSDWLTLFSWQPFSILIIGSFVAFIVVFLNIVAMKVFSEEAFNDGGLNKKLFKGLSIPHILFLSMVIAFCEEVFFRGVIQSSFGLVVASIVFAGLHFRYISKPVLFIGVIVLSFLIGIIFEWTGNLFVTIMIHFLIDAMLGLLIRLQLVEGGA